MNLTHLRQVFESASSIQDMYPPVKRQIRYLQTLHEEYDKMNTRALVKDEVSRFRTFLTNNYNCKNGEFTDRFFRGKTGSVNMERVLDLLAEAHKAEFIDALRRVAKKG